MIAAHGGQQHVDKNNMKFHQFKVNLIFIVAQESHNKLVTKSYTYEIKLNSGDR